MLLRPFSTCRRDNWEAVGMTGRGEKRSKPSIRRLLALAVVLYRQLSASADALWLRWADWWQDQGEGQDSPINDTPRRDEVAASVSCCTTTGAGIHRAFSLAIVFVEIYIGILQKSRSFLSLRKTARSIPRGCASAERARGASMIPRGFRSARRASSAGGLTFDVVRWPRRRFT